jgi:predicted peroxiredoxin
VLELMAAQRIVIVLWSCGPDRPGGPVLAAAPFVYALTARALDLDVEMHFTSSTVRWLVEGVADVAHTDAAATHTVGQYLREVRSAGISLHACTMALAEHRRADERLVEGVRMAGAATVIGAAVHDDCRTLVF